MLQLLEEYHNNTLNIGKPKLQPCIVGNPVFLCFIVHLKGPQRLTYLTVLLIRTVTRHVHFPVG